MNSRRFRNKGRASERRDARVLLRTELAAVTRLFDRFETSRSMARKKAIVEQICLALTVQAQLENEILYPALKRACNNHAFGPRARQHQAILKSLIDEVQGNEPDDDGYEASVRLMAEQVKHHVARQDAIFPADAARQLDLAALGAQLASRKRELLAGMSDFGGWD